MHNKFRLKSTQEIKSLVMKHLEDKYNQKFIIIDDISNDIRTIPTKDYNYAISVYPKDNTDVTAIVYISQWNYKIWDNFFWFIIKDEYYSLLKNIVNKAFDNNILIIYPIDKIYKNKFKKDSTLNEFLETYNNFIATSDIYISSYDFNKDSFKYKLNFLGKEICCSKIRTYFFIRVVKNDLYDSINNYSINELLNINGFIKYEKQIIINQNFQFEVL